MDGYIPILAALMLGLPNGVPAEQSTPVVECAPLHAKRIVCVKVLEVTASDWRQDTGIVSSRTLRARLNLERTLKGGDAVAAAPEPFEVVILQERSRSARITDNLSEWSPVELTKGARLVLLSGTSDVELNELVKNPSKLLLDPDPVVMGELEFIIDAGGRALKEQESRVKEFLRAAPAVHGEFLAEYFAILAYRAAGEGVQDLVKFLSRTRELSLSEKAQRFYLDGIRRQIQASPPPQMLIGGYLTASVRALAIHEDKKPSAEIEAEVFQIYLAGLVRRGDLRKGLEAAGFDSKEIEGLREILAFYAQQEKSPPEIKRTASLLLEKTAPEEQK